MAPNSSGQVPALPMLFVLVMALMVPSATAADTCAGDATGECIIAGVAFRGQRHSLSESPDGPRRDSAAKIQRRKGSQAASRFTPALEPTDEDTGMALMQHYQEVSQVEDVRERARERVPRAGSTAEVRAFNLHKRYFGAHLRAVDPKSNVRSWILMFRPGTSDDILTDACHTVGDRGCHLRGHPATSGVPFLHFEGDDTVVGNLTQKYKDEIELIEPDPQRTPEALDFIVPDPQLQLQPEALDLCIGDSENWDAGWGGCYTYAPGTYNSGYCLDDEDDAGTFAYEACEECRLCVTQAVT